MLLCIMFIISPCKPSISFRFIGLLFAVHFFSPSYAEYLSWTREHQECFTKIISGNETTNDGSSFVQCHDANYFTYVQQNSNKPQSEFHRNIYSIITTMYADLKVNRQPTKVTLEKDVFVYPVSFCIPDENIVKTIPKKTKSFGRVIPGEYSTYFDLRNESQYFEDMGRSLFAITYKKNGWDCLRHLEILAAGCIPLFIDIASTPQVTLAAHPKKLYAQLLQYPGLKYEAVAETHMKKKFKTLDFNIPSLHKELYLTIAAALLQYTRNVLSTKSMASFVYQTMVTNSFGAIPSSPKKIFYLTHQDHDMDKGDYMTDFLLHGFKQLFGAAVVVDFPRRDGIYKTSYEFNETEYYKTREQLYGLGFSWGLKLDDFANTKERDNAVITDNIINRRYDAIILGSGHRDGWASKLFFWDLVCKHYPPSQVGFVEGSDRHLHKKLLHRYAKCANHLFSREGYVGDT